MINQDSIKRNKEIIFNSICLLLVYKVVIIIAAFFYFYYTFHYIEFDIKLLLNFWTQWDAKHYLDIAKNGYDITKANMAFYPLYPLLIYIFSPYFGFELSAHIINSLVQFGLILGLYKLALLDLDRCAAWRACFYLLLFPAAIFFNSIYTESLFLFFAVWIFYYARLRKWSEFSAFGFFIGLTRIEGLAVMLFVLFEYMQGIKFKFNLIKLDMLYVFSPLFGLLSYLVYLKVRHGDYFLFLTSQSAWGKEFTLPWSSINSYLEVFFNSTTQAFYISRDIDLFFFLFGVFVSVCLMFMLRFSYGIYSLFTILMVSFTGDLVSSNRRFLLLFPAFILFAKWGEDRYVNFFIIFIFQAFFFLNMFRFIHGFWVG